MSLERKIGEMGGKLDALIIEVQAVRDWQINHSGDGENTAHALLKKEISTVKERIALWRGIGIGATGLLGGSALAWLKEIFK